MHAELKIIKQKAQSQLQNTVDFCCKGGGGGSLTDPSLSLSAAVCPDQKNILEQRNVDHSWSQENQIRRPSVFDLTIPHKLSLFFVFEYFKTIDLVTLLFWPQQRVKIFT